MLEQQKINSFVKAFWNLNGWRWCRLTVYLTWFTTYINLIPLPPFQVPMEFSLMAAWAAAVRLSFCDNILSVILQRPHVGCDSDLPNTTWYVGLGETWGAKARRRQWTNLLNWSLENGWWLTRKKVNLSAACMPGLASYAPLGCQSHVERDPIKHDSGVTRMHARRQARLIAATLGSSGHKSAVLSPFLFNTRVCHYWKRWWGNKGFGWWDKVCPLHFFHRSRGEWKGVSIKVVVCSKVVVVVRPPAVKLDNFSQLELVQKAAE